MTTYVAKTAANMLLKKHMKGYQQKKVESGYDPYFAMIEDPKRPGKMKKVKKQVPAYIPEHDAVILASVRKTAYRLDMSLFDFAGIRFGWEAVIGIIPAVGDVFGLMFALMIFNKCRGVDGGLDSSTTLRMLINIIIDFVIGLVPIIGDLGDAAFKCNTKNVRLLEEHLDRKHKPSSQGRDARDYAGVSKEKLRKNRQSGIYYAQDPPPATVFEDFSDEEDERRDFMRQTDTPAAGRAPVVGSVPAAGRAPAPATRPAAPVDKKRASWFSGGRSTRPAPSADLGQSSRV